MKNQESELVFVLVESNVLTKLVKEYEELQRWKEEKQIEEEDDNIFEFADYILLASIGCLSFLLFCNLLK